MMIANTVKKVLRRARRGEPERTQPRIIIQMEASENGNPKLKPTMYLPNLSIGHRQVA